MLNVLVLMSLFVSLSFGHVCLLSPYQRPGYVNDTQLSVKGAGECGLTTYPCGGVAAGSVINSAIMSETLTFVMEKNLDHYNATTPGNFTIALWSSNGTYIRDLGHVSDDSRASGSIYQVKVTIPHEVGKSRVIIQATYYTNNPDAPPAFYQCADLAIYPRS